MVNARRATRLSFELDSLAGLFEARHQDPFDPAYDPQPGIEKVLRGVGAITLARRRFVELDFTISSDDGQPDAAGRLRAALRRFCWGRRQQLESKRDILRHVGWRELWTGLGLLALCLLLSNALSDSALPPFVERLFGEGLIIAGWVVLWRPVETLVFDKGRINREIELLDAVAALPVSVTLAPETQKSKKGP